MSRKAILVCAAAAAALLAVVAVAVAVLYSGTGSGEETLDDSRYELLAAVPTDAVAVMRFESVGDMISLLADNSSVLNQFTGSYGQSSFVKFLSSLHDMSGHGALPLKSSPAVISFHYNGELVPLLVVDAGRASAEISEDASLLMSAADSAGIYPVYSDCSGILSPGDGLYRKSIVAASPSEALVASSSRHLSRRLSVADAKGFVETASEADGSNLLLISCGEAEKLAEEIFSPRYRKYADFLSDMTEWLAFSIYSADEGHLYLSGKQRINDNGEDFMSVLADMPGAASSVSSIAPSYSVFVASLPLGDSMAYLSSYGRFRDFHSGSAASAAAELEKMSGISPEDWCRTLDIEEVASVSFFVGKDLEDVVLLKVGNPDVPVIFKGTEVTSLKDYVPQVHEYAYPGFAASLFGSLFSPDDESAFTYIDGWIVSGSRAAVQEYASGRALENTLKRYMGDAGLPDRLSSRKRCLVAYFSAAESPGLIGDMFSPAVASAFEAAAEGVSYMPLTFSVGTSRSSLDLYAELDRVVVTKSKAPEFERDTLIEVPKGPFRVKNSGTGRMNLFYQQDNMYLCLQEEDGRGLWGAPFSSPICGRAGTIDYFANGKLQILFASGSKLYLIDRLGRFVNPFPVDLGKKITLGPDIYDFNGTRKYNVMVLHDDNTIDMYNLQGKKPAAWKGITADETIKGLPEPVKVSGKTYWVVRTSIRTLIFPFYGGDPVTTGSGDKMIRSDSKVVPSGANSVTVVCYDGRERTLEL